MTDEPNDNVSTKLLEEGVRREFERRSSGTGSGGNDGFETRLTRVERHMDELRVLCPRLETKIDQLLKEVYELKGRVSQLPSLWQLFLLLMTFVVAIFGLAFAFVRFAIPHA
jgi:hypothetical protein